MQFQCTDPNCGKEHSRTASEIQDGDPGAMMIEIDVARMDCPHCKTAKSCLFMTKCPKCSTYYLAASTLQMAESMARGRGGLNTTPTEPVEPVRDLCPKCGTDRMEFFRKKFFRKKYKDRKSRK
jgi:glutaredoxin